MSSPDLDQNLQTLPLDAWHRARGARMVPFAGYAMPIQYDGIVAEHDWTRTHAGLFDVSHMGQLFVSGEGAEAAPRRRSGDQERPQEDQPPPATTEQGDSGEEEDPDLQQILR